MEKKEKGGDRMKRSVIPAALIGSLFICVILAMLLLYLREAPYAGTPSSMIESRFVGGYVLTLWEGKIAIRQTGDEFPCRVYDLPATMLSVYDRATLERGVACETLAAAERLAEDYIG